MAINKYGDKGIKWVSHGMLRIEVSVMKKLFEHPVNKMIEVGSISEFLYIAVQFLGRIMCKCFGSISALEI